MERRPGFQQESDDVGRARRREAAQNEDGEAAVRREALPRGERADADGAASSRCPRTASMSGRQCWREVKAAKGETRAEGKRASWVAGDEAEMANLATSDLATLRPVCVPTGGGRPGAPDLCPASSTSLLRLCTWIEAGLMMGGRGVRPTSPRSSKDRPGSWFVMVIRAGPGLNTTRHNTRRPLLSLPWPCRPASRCLAISAKGWASVCRGGCEGAI